MEQKRKSYSWTRQQGGDCWGEAGVRGLNGDGKNNKDSIEKNKK